MRWRKLHRREPQHRSVGRDESCSYVLCACWTTLCERVLVLFSLTTSPLFTTWAAAAAPNTEQQRIRRSPKWWVRSKLPARGLFTSALVPAPSLYLPPVSLCRVRTRLFLLCFVSEMQTPTSTAPDQVPSRGRVFVRFKGFCMFFVVFSQVAVWCNSPHALKILSEILKGTRKANQKMRGWSVRAFTK